MAAQVLLLLLTLTLFSNNQAEVIKRPGTSHHFLLDGRADICSIYKWTGERKQLLWNSQSSYYQLSGLAVSHSGQYQVQCWTRGTMTLEKNTTLLICDDQKMSYETLEVNVGETVELTCGGVGPNQRVQWAYLKSKNDGLVPIDDEAPSEYRHQLAENKPSLLLTVDKQSVGASYYCLEKQQRKCELHSHFYVRILPEYILRSVGESLELNCSDVGRNQRHKWAIFNSLSSGRESRNTTLMFPSLTLAQSGRYTCELTVSGPRFYLLYVCPEPEPPAEERFTERGDFTLDCGNWSETDEVFWFMRSNRTKGQVFDVRYQRLNNVYLGGRSLVIKNISLQDSGQVWCVVEKDHLCVFRSETLVKLREPEVDHHLLRSVLLSVVMLMMLCVVVVVVMVWRSRRGEQLAAPVEEVEMSQLSPDSNVQDEAPV